MEKLYTASVIATGGRDGHVKSNDGILDVELRRPKEMGGQGGASNPEQLFAAAWGACYLGALGSVADHEGIEASEATVNVQVSFNEDGKAFALSAELDIHIPGLGHDETQRIAEMAHKTCPYSKAVKGNIEVRVSAV
ncbi:MAG: organic hydroperoxide resistance protein [Pedobacter sp.]|nr:MAG: organic hydroperoxide resistance protein [Pedobacter sp.]